VANVIPVISPDANQTANEGASTLFGLGSFADPGADSPWQVTVAWGDGSVNTVFTESAVGAITSKYHTYADDGTYTVSVGVVEENGTGAAAVNKTFTVTVANIPPSVPFLVAPSDNAITNDNTPTFDWTDSTDAAGPNDTITYRLQADNSGCSFSSPELNQPAIASSTFTPGVGLSDGTYCWRVSASDEDGGTSAFSTTRNLTIDATAPTLAITFPLNGGSYSELDWNAGCSTSATGDACGTATDATSGLDSVWISLRRASDGYYWNWTTSTWASISETNVNAQKSFTSATWSSWIAAFPFTNFGSSGSYTIHARATDVASNQTDVSNTFTLNRYTLQFQSPLDQSNGTTVVLNTGKNGRGIPVKVVVFRDGVTQTSTQIPDGNLTISVNLVTCGSNAVTDGVELYEDSGNANGGTNQFRWTDDHWHYNLDTKALGLVTDKCYRLDVYLKNPVTGLPIRISTQQFAIFKPVK
jgi:hypothetical protein